MGAAGRNERCECGSGRKAKRCCGVQRGPSEGDLARAFLASQVGPSARVLRSFPDDELDDLLAEMIDLPCLDTSLHLPLPRLLTPDVDRLLVAIEEGDPGVAAVALFELAAPKLQSLVSSAVVHAAGVALGDVATPSGLLVTG